MLFSMVWDIFMKRMTEFGKANDGKGLIPVIHLELFVPFLSFFCHIHANFTDKQFWHQ
jgi:hypothetical protein